MRFDADGSDGPLVDLARADPDDLLDGKDEDLSVSDLSGPGCRRDGRDRRLDEVVRDADLEPHLLGELHLHRRAAVGLHALRLAPVPLDARDRQPLDVSPEERFQDVVHFLGSDDGHDELHERTSEGTAGVAAARGETGTDSRRRRRAPSPVV